MVDSHLFNVRDMLRNRHSYFSCKQWMSRYGRIQIDTIFTYHVTVLFSMFLCQLLGIGIKPSSHLLKDNALNLVCLLSESHIFALAPIIEYKDLILWKQ